MNRAANFFGSPDTGDGMLVNNSHYITIYHLRGLFMAVCSLGFVKLMPQLELETHWNHQRPPRYTIILTINETENQNL